MFVLVRLLLRIVSVVVWVAFGLVPVCPLSVRYKSLHSSSKQSEMSVFLYVSDGVLSHSEQRYDRGVREPLDFPDSLSESDTFDTFLLQAMSIVCYYFLFCVVISLECREASAVTSSVSGCSWYLIELSSM